MNIVSRKSKGIKGDVWVPGDKSISHRAAMLLSLSNGEANISNFLMSQDCLNTLRAMSMAGASIEVKENLIKVNGKGKKILRNPGALVYLGNSGTSMRLLSGIFCGLEGTTLLYGDNSLNMRPMDRIVEPLRLMGGHIKSIQGNGRAPLFIKGGRLRGIEYNMKIASAQVKSSILLASLFSDGCTKIIEKNSSRDHTERMLNYLGCRVIKDNYVISMECGQELIAGDIVVPGDISSAAFLIGAAIITPNSDLTIRNVLFNKTRTGFIDVMMDMGADIEVSELKVLNNEEVVDIRVRSSNLRGIIIGGDLIPRLIDEIPLIAVLASLAEGRTIISDASELKHKESNRIRTTVDNLSSMGIIVQELMDGMIIEGRSSKSTGDINFISYGDHRIAMAFSLLGLVHDNVYIEDIEIIQTSFPGYIKLMNSIGASMQYVS